MSPVKCRQMPAVAAAAVNLGFITQGSACPGLSGGFQEMRLVCINLFERGKSRIDKGEAATNHREADTGSSSLISSPE